MLTIPRSLVKETHHEALQPFDRGYADTVTISTRHLTDEVLAALHEAAEEEGQGSLARSVESMIAARAGDTSQPVRNLISFPDLLLSVLRENFIDGWLYRTGRDGHTAPWLVTDVKYIAGTRSDDKPHVTVSLVADGGRSSGYNDKRMLGQHSASLTFYGADVVRKKVTAALEKKGYLLETPALKAAYEDDLATFEEVLGGFAEQFRYTGAPGDVGSSWKTPNDRLGAKVIHDLKRSEMAPRTDEHETVLVVDADAHEQRGLAEVPMHCNMRVFDLSTHEFLWVHTSDLTRYVYDKSLREKIVLPEDQRNLLDILTTNLDDFTGDIIEGKSAGNVVMCKGEPGVGKTLTAEVYSELIERPLYSIHSGSLGTTADTVRSNLEEIFDRAQRWKAVLLLDEADVFVLERGDNLQQNAIVAEFLRTLEYFTGLMFMTTNRAKDIDDAILSRAAAIIDYKVPDVDGIREVWKVLAANQKADLPESLLEDLVHGFAHIAPRDVKMLLRLAMRVAAGQGEPLSAEIFAKCAMFRGLHFEPGIRTA